LYQKVKKKHKEISSVGHLAQAGFQKFPIER
jgi:hypothetical protein